MSLEGQFKALEGNSAVDDELARMKGQVSLLVSAIALLSSTQPVLMNATSWVRCVLHS